MMRLRGIFVLMLCTNAAFAYEQDQAMSLDSRTVLHLDSVESVRGQRVAELSDGAIVSAIRVECETNTLRIERTGIDRADGSFEISNGMPGNYFVPKTGEVLATAVRKICNMKLEDE